MITIKKVWYVILGIVLACYPLVVYLGLKTHSLKRMTVLIIGAFLLRLLVLRGAKSGSFNHLAIPATLAGIVLAAITLWQNSGQALLFYPVVASICGLCVFAWSLVKPPSVIEILARLREDTLPPEVVAYTRKVTMIWCLFFVINAGIAGLSVASGDMAFWTLYNGLISYVLMGVLMGGEWLYRKWLLKV